MYCGRRINYFVLICWSFIYAVKAESDNQNIIVNLPELGSVQGGEARTEFTGQTFYEFLGIHFAESPSGDRRFKRPVPKAPWNGTLGAIKPGRICPTADEIESMDEQDQTDIEDCLHLSVYTRNTESNMPVMVWIHGGGFSNGSSNYYRGNYLLEKKIVLVALQYRLGPLGFLSTNTPEIPGNAALHDILLALEWIQKYIKYFGGNPNLVTLFGQSAGAILINALQLSPAVREGLFHQVIFQSGCILQETVVYDAVQRSKEIAEKACNSSNSIEDVNNCLQNIPTSTLISIGEQFSYTVSVNDFYGIFPEAPTTLLQKLKKNYPTIGGVVKHDGSFILALFYDLLLENNLLGKLNGKQLIDMFVQRMIPTDSSAIVTNLFAKLLFTQEQLTSRNFTQLIPGLIDLLSVGAFKSPTLTFMQKLAELNPNIFLYTFDYKGQYTQFGYGHDTSYYPFKGGVHHSDDYLYLFPNHNLNRRDRQVAENMVSFWTTFARTGVPSARNQDLPFWPAMSEITGPYLHIDCEPYVGRDFATEFTASVVDGTNSTLLSNL